MLVLIAAYLGSQSETFNPDVLYLWVALMDFAWILVWLQIGESIGKIGKGGIE